MAEPVGDLVVDLSLDAARFDEQMARVRRHFSGTESDAKKTAAVVEQSLSRQALAAQKAGISVGQYKAAMRMLPAQFTDVATQLAGGQSPWLILLQQGAGEGLLRRDDPHVPGLAGAITLPMVGATSLAVATGALAYAVSGQLNPVRFQQNAGPFRQSVGSDGRSYAGPVQSRAGGRADV
ncbi:hypothetical protein ECZU20_43160 [Escherichia coli]|nr:hypothetical protein ECZU20_43160 [Escherichia coli]